MNLRRAFSHLGNAVLIGLLAILAFQLVDVREAFRRAELVQKDLVADPSQAMFESVLRRIEEHHVDPHEGRELYRAAINGLLSDIGDPYATLLEPGEYEDLRIETTGEYGGVGMEVGSRSGWVTVISTMPGEPARAAGILAGDRIVTIDGDSMKGRGVEDAVQRMRGSVGTVVELGVMHPGDTTVINISVTRDSIQTTSVPVAYLTPDSIGYVELQGFSETSGADLAAQIERLSAEGMQGLIIDLRRNPGGLLSAAQDVAELFLEKGDTIAVLYGRSAEVREALVADDAPVRDTGLPVAVLVGEHTASAAEILAGALQDHGRATVIGERTYGKGSVQTVFPLPGKQWLKLSTGRWYTPSGRSIQRLSKVDAEAGEADPRGGIQPDSVVEWSVDPAAVRLRDHLGLNWPRFLDVIYSHAVEIARHRKDLRTDFSVTSADIRALHSAVQRAGIEIPGSLFTESRRWIETELESQIAYARWGASAATERLNRHDPVFNAAHGLLRSREASDVRVSAQPRS